MAAVGSPRFAMPSADKFTAPIVSTAGSAPMASRSQYLKWPLVMLRLSTCSGCRMAASASCTMSGLFTNGAGGLSRLIIASKEGLEKWTDRGPVRLSLEQFAIRQAQHSALRHDHMKPRRLKSYAAKNASSPANGRSSVPFGDQFRIRHRRPQPRATDPVVRLGEFHIEIRRLETGLGEDISQIRRPPEQPRPASARQRNPANLEGRVGGTQCDRLSDQAIGAHRVIAVRRSATRTLDALWQTLAPPSLCHSR